MYQQQNLQKVAPARQTPKPKAVTDKLRRNQIERQFREREKENELWNPWSILQNSNLLISIKLTILQNAKRCWISAQLKASLVGKVVLLLMLIPSKRHLGNV